MGLAAVTIFSLNVAAVLNMTSVVESERADLQAVRKPASDALWSEPPKATAAFQSGKRRPFLHAPAPPQQPVSLVPAPAGDPNPLCYEMPNATYANKVHKVDFTTRKHAEQNGSCAEFGYPTYVAKDPSFKDAALFRKRAAGEAAVELAD